MNINRNPPKLTSVREYYLATGTLITELHLELLWVFHSVFVSKNVTELFLRITIG